MKNIVTLSICFMCLAASASAQNCKKGIPCGGTCISASKTCHVGTASSTQVKPTDTLSDVAKARLDSALKEHNAYRSPSAALASTRPMQAWDEAPLLAATLQLWSGHRIVFANASALPRAGNSARVALVYADHFVARSGTTSLLVPYWNIEMLYAENPPTVDTASLVVVFRGKP